MLLTVHDSQFRKVAFLDNSKQDTLNYTDDKWHRVLETGSSTFEFTVPKKNLEMDTVFSKLYNHLNEKSYISFRYRERNFVFPVIKVEENYRSIRCTCFNLNLDMINAQVDGYSANTAMTFAQYCDVFGIVNERGLRIGINEIADKQLKLSWEGSESKVKRLLSLAQKFDAEIEFDVQFHDDSTIKNFSVNVFRTGDGVNNHGVGRIRKDLILKRGKNLQVISRTVDKSGIYNALKLKGKGKAVVNNNTWKVLNGKGEVEFYQKGDTLYAPLSLQMYPTAFPDKNGEQWSKKTLEVDSDNAQIVRDTGYRELKKLAYPALTYIAEGDLLTDLGDTVRLQDDGFVPTLVLEARVIEQTISFTKPSQNKSIYGNFKALENRVSRDLMARLEELVELARPYSIKIETEGGLFFKNNIGQTRVEATLYKGGKVINDVLWRWKFGDNTSDSQDYLVEGSSVTDTKVLNVIALVNGEEVASEKISFANVFDGAAGKPGLAGADGRTPLVHTAWANSADGSVGFSTTQSFDKAYLGTCTTYLDVNPTGADPQDFRLYSWSKTKGDAGRGIVSTVHYFLATAQGSGVTASSSGWTTTAQYPTETKRYLWNYTVTQYSDNTSQTSVPIIISVYGQKGDKGDPGNDGIAGRDGVGIRSTVVTYGLSSSDTVQPTSWSGSVPSLVKGQYLWTKTVWTYTDNRTEVGYQKTYVSRDGNNGRDGIAGRDGVGIRSTTILYASSTSGTTAPVTGWVSNPPVVSAGQYLWTKTIWAYTDNTSEIGYSVAKMGDVGERGPQGPPGPKGTFEGEVGGRNLLIGTKNFSGNWHQSSSWLDEAVQYRGLSVKKRNGLWHGLCQPCDVFAGETYTFSVYAKSDLPNDMVMFYLNHYLFVPGVSATITSTSVAITNNWQRVSVTFKVTSDGKIAPRLERKDTNAYLYIAGYQLEIGTIATSKTEAPEDVEMRIREEAERAAYGLTKLQEEAQAMRVEIEAKALASEVKQWLAEYKEFAQNANRVTDDLTRSFFKSQERIVEMEHHLKENALLLSFVNTYLRASDDGVTLGNKDNSEYIQVTPKGIQLMSAGIAVATIANGLMKTAHGVLTDSLQVGHYRFEQSKRNAAINVWRYVD